MQNKFYAILTDIGAAKLSNAVALGMQLEITHMAVGDGGGVETMPDATQTALINECYRAPLNTLTVDENNANQIIAEMIIPETIGGWFIRETGLYDSDNDLIAISNAPESYKPQLQEGSGRTQMIRIVIIVSNADSVSLKIDPAVVLATRQYVDGAILTHEKSRNHPDATLQEKGFVKLSNATDSDDETTAATSKAVNAAVKSAGYGRLIGIQTFTESGTYTPSDGVRAVKVIVTGAGGHGSGISQYQTRGSGGGAGGTAIKFLTVSGPVVVTVGKAAGGTSSFGQFVSATGGLSTTGNAGAEGGNGVGGDINIKGGYGSDAAFLNEPAGGSGDGGSGYWGGSQRSSADNMINGGSFGSGGGGTGDGELYGIGEDGVVYIEEYA